MTSETISCIICTHRAPRSMEVLLQSLLQQHWQAGDEVVLIDNGVAPERLNELDGPLADLRNRQVRVVVEKEERPGLTNARLKSFTIATNSWFVLLDDDNVLAPDALQNIRKCLSEHRELGGICPQIQPLWERPAPNWIVALGHQVLSYNSTYLSKTPYTFAIWRDGMVGARPPGGGMIVHRRAADEFNRLASIRPSVRNLGRKGSLLSGGEDFVIYGFLYDLGMATAYDDSILIYHQISPERMEFSYLLRLLYHANFSYGILGIMRFGKRNVIYSALRGTARLIYEFLIQSITVPSWRLLLAFAFALYGYWLGTWSGFFDKSCLYLPKTTAKQPTQIANF